MRISLANYTAGDRDRSGEQRIVRIEHSRGADVGAIGRALQADGIYAAVRQGRIRLSPHLYDTASEIDRALNAVERSLRRL
jgi:selenocysteine lyase/cysteine desulfurase